MPDSSIPKSSSLRDTQPAWLACPPTQQELFGSSCDASATALALHLAVTANDQAKPAWLWVQDAASIRLTGRPFMHGLPPALRHGLVHIAATNAADALFALEEGVRCRDFAFVLGELAGDPRALDFTASRRLSVASEQHGVPLYLVRLDAQPGLSAARRRWRVTAHPGHPDPWNACAPGSARWQAELFRARGMPPGEWIVDDARGRQQVGLAGARIRGTADETAGPPHHVDLADAARYRPLAARRNS